MAKAFGAELGATNDPSYIGFSREGEADKSMKVLFGGLANIIDQKANYWEDMQKDEADKTAEAIVNTTTPAPKPVEGGSGTEKIVGGAGTDSVSADIKNVGTRGAKLTQQYEDGVITESQYWSQMAAMVKSARARYPSQADRIEAQVAQALGRNPAAAAIQAQRKEWESSLAEKNEEEKTFNRFVDTNLEYIPPDFFERQNKGQPYTKIETRNYVMERQQEKAKIEQRKAKLALAREQGNLNEEDATATALDEVTGYANRVIVDTADTSKNFTDLLQRAQTKGKDFTPDEQMMLRTSFAQLKFQVQTGVENIMSKPWADNKSTYYNQIKSPEKIKHIKESAMSRIEYYEKMINDKDYGLLNADLNRTKAMKDEVNRKVLESSDAIRTYQAVKDIGGSDLLNELILSPEGQKLKTDAAKSLRNVTLGRLMSGDAKSIEEEIRRNKSANVDKTERGKIGWQQIKDSVGILENDKANTQIKLNTSNALFGTENRNFLSSINQDQRMEVYGRLASPSVTKQMVELGKTDPQAWKQYRDWVKLGFGTVFRDLANTVQEGVTSRPNISIKWDANAKQFVTELGAENKSDWRNPLSGGLRAIENKFTDNVSQSVEAFNKQLRVLTPIMEADGQDVSEELLGFLNALGIDDMAPKDASWFTKLRGAMIKNFEKNNPPKGGEGEGKKR
jgi:hypothetical protein